MLYSIKARTVVMVSASRGAGLSTAQATAEEAAMGGDGGSMSSAALERVVATATATYNEWYGMVFDIFLFHFFVAGNYFLFYAGMYVPRKIGERGTCVP